jgi:tetratricopeptide (TPR) repeat protein
LDINNEFLDSLERQNEKDLEKRFAKELGFYYIGYVQPKYDEIAIDGGREEESVACKRLLSDEKIAKSEDLTYFIYTKLYRCYMKSSMYDSALSYIGLALSVRHESIFPLIRKSEIFEFTGKKEKSIQAYEHALRLAKNHHSELAEYIRDQIERVRYHGVRKAPAITGLRYMTY